MAGVCFRMNLAEEGLDIEAPAVRIIEYRRV